MSKSTQTLDPETSATVLAASARAKLEIAKLPLLGTLFRVPTFAALRYRNFMLLWLGMLNDSGAMWMEQVARSWLMWQLTGSPLALGLVSLFRASPFLLFASISGVVVDRFDKRSLLIVAEATQVVLALSLSALVFTGLVQPWHVYLTAFLSGSAMTVNQPARQSLVPLLVDDPDLMNAIALNSMAANLNRVLGPAIAGVLIGMVGIGSVYALQGFAFAAFVVAAALMKLPSTARVGGSASPWRDMKDGIGYILSNPIISGLIVLALVPSIFGMPYQAILPVFADEVLGIGASGLGLLMSSAGIGALVSSVIIASSVNLRRKGPILLIGVFVFGLGLVGFSMSLWLAVSMLTLGVVGLCQVGFMTITNTSLLVITPREYQGRVMSIYMLDRGLVPLGSLFVGALAELATAPLALGLMGILCMALAMGMTLALPAIRQL